MGYLPEDSEQTFTHSHMMHDVMNDPHEMRLLTEVKMTEIEQLPNGQTDYKRPENFYFPTDDVTCIPDT